MKIYPQEINDGVGEKVMASASIEYCSLLKMPMTAKANTEQPDLYPLRSVLVSTGWNKNTDVFDKGETWKARHTPVHKKIDFQHDELTIIGHINKAYVIDNLGNPINDDIQDKDLPDEYHIITEGFLYTFWSNEERKQLIATIIEEIPEDKWYVSMECIFDNFDYAINDGEKNYVVARNESTAYLTKHLRMYGGTGEYQGYKVGRLLRDLTFSGKGIVKNPANPNSVILDTEAFVAEKEVDTFNFTKSSVCKFKGEYEMSDELKEAQDRIRELETALNAKASAEHDTKIKTLEVQLSTACAERDGFSERLSATEQALQNLENELAEAKKAKEEMMKEKDMMAKKAKCSQRASLLIQAGVPETEAHAKSEEWADVEDKYFNEYVEVMKAKHTQVEAKVEPKVEPQTDPVASALSTAEAQPEPKLVTEPEVPNDVVASVAKYFESALKKNKGEK